MPTPAELETMPLEELRKLAVQQVEGGTPEPESEAEVVPEPKKRFRREIDLEDGAGVQVFEGATMDELLEKLTEAQRNATKKIRQQNETLRNLFPDGQVPKTEPEPEPKTLEERLARIERNQKAQAAAEQWNDITTTFVSLHPEYEATPKNAGKLLRYMKAEGIAQTLPGLEKAFKELVDDGLLATIPEQTEEVLEEEEAEEPKRIATVRTQPTPNATPRRKVSSGLSVRNTARVATKEPVEDLYKMPLDELKKKAFAQIRGRQ